MVREWVRYKKLERKRVCEREREREIVYSIQREYII